MKFGLDIFNIDHPVYPELSFVEKECSLLETIWNLKEEWDDKWVRWKDTKFDHIDSNEMNDEAQDFSEKLKNTDREIRNWGIYDHLKNKIESFLQTMPLIGELRNPAIRDRHWRQLKIEVSNEFNEKADDFTLEKVFSLHLNQHNDFIQELCTNATKELRIENQLDMIEYTWTQDPKTDLILKKEVSKGTGEEFYKIETAENIYAVIEDHVVILSNNKSGAFYKQFEARIDDWEDNLARISETLEMLMIVQSKWGYLESIFTGQQDIMKQLSQEHTVFQGVNAGFKEELERINSNRNACKALLSSKGLDKKLEEMDEKLEHIQKNLDDYLKLKRQNFPRFFFLSNEDLLEIMGQSKDPAPMNKHVKKCFEGIQKLRINRGTNKSKPHQIVSLIAPDGEEVALTAPISGCDKVEDWFQKLLESMQAEVKAFFKENKNELRDALKRNANPDKLGNAIKTSKGQYLLTSCQIDWTHEVTTTLTSIEQGSAPTAFKKLKNNYKNKVDKYTNFVKKLIDDANSRNKLVALITIEQHNKDIIDSLQKKNVASPKHFEWEQQLKVTKEENPTDVNEPPAIIIKQTNCRFEYGNEYQGNNGRLVITPLTDRAYMTLTNALNMCRGGAPQGPAGTGKTETVKDLGKNLAYFVVVQNCSDSLDFQSLGKMFEGLASAGVWGCFDEFNRIEIEVLSVVAQQISTILDAIKKKAKTTIFEDSEIPVKHTCGIFITMNPGYAGRTELPDNLKSLFRPVAMMVPGFIIIAKIILMSEGFENSEDLSVKVCKMFDLMKRQLSKQDHYDFSMRAIKSVLSTSGRIKRQRQDQDEYTIMIKAIRDMNLPKLVAEDVILFDNLFLDLFPNIEEPYYENDDLLLAIEDALTARKLQINANLAVKIVQLYESKITRHGNMLVGKTLSGKTTLTEVLYDACNLLADQMQNEDKFPKVLKEVINPKSISNNELFGYFDSQLPPQWHDGILSTVLKRMCQDTRKVNYWLILDGPVDTLWIESMNSVLDDNKVLTLNNGDRIALTDRVRLLFEVENLAQASQATVSRAGMVYVDIDDLGWKPIIEVWIEQKEDPELREILGLMINKYLNKVLMIKKTQCKELVQTSEVACVRNLCQLFDNQMLNYPDGGNKDEKWRELVEKLFVY
jgi:dynein heavy chain, axonemal